MTISTTRSIFSFRRHNKEVCDDLKLPYSIFSAQEGVEAEMKAARAAALRKPTRKGVRGVLHDHQMKTLSHHVDEEKRGGSSSSGGGGSGKDVATAGSSKAPVALSKGKGKALSSQSIELVSNYTPPGKKQQQHEV